MAKEDPFDSAEWREWAADIEERLIPTLKDTGLVVSLVPEGASDIKFAVELGLAIMMDKPIIAMVRPGVRVPDKLVMVADEIIEVDLVANPERAAKSIKAAIERMGLD